VKVKIAFWEASLLCSLFFYMMECDYSWDLDFLDTLRQVMSSQAGHGLDSHSLAMAVSAGFTIWLSAGMAQYIYMRASRS
jgi:hypothetical protein